MKTEYIKTICDNAALIRDYAHQKLLDFTHYDKLAKQIEIDAEYLYDSRELSDINDEMLIKAVDMAKHNVFAAHHIYNQFWHEMPDFTPLFNAQMTLSKLGKSLVMTAREARQYCKDLERIRERDYRETEQGAFEASMCSTEELIDAFDDPSKIKAFSDCGMGAEAIRNFQDGVGMINDAKKCINRARMKIERANKKLLNVFYLVLKNGTNRKESIWELASQAKSNGTPRGCFTSGV